MNAISKYTFSFTGASALTAETRVVAEEFSKLKDWVLVNQVLASDNRLNKIKQATFKRQLQELKKRIDSLTHAQLNVLVQGSLDEAKAMILISLVKAYPLFMDFIVEVVRTKYFLFDRILTETDYLAFIQSKSLSHPELEEISEATAKKVKQRIYTLIEQVGLISQVKNGAILKPYLSPDIIKIICSDNPSLLRVFLFTDAEIKSYS